MSKEDKRIIEARDVAAAIHQGDMYNGESYVTGHLDEVLSMLDELYEKYCNHNMDIPIDDLRAAAYLHDILEDHPDKVSMDSIRDRFGGTVAALVEELAKGENEEYVAYIIRLAKCSPASLLKLADLQANLAAHEGNMSDDSKSPNSYECARADKYDLASVILTEHLMSIGWMGGPKKDLKTFEVKLDAKLHMKPINIQAADREEAQELVGMIYRASNLSIDKQDLVFKTTEVKDDNTE